MSSQNHLLMIGLLKAQKKDKIKPKGISQIAKAVKSLNEKLEIVDPILLTEYKKKSIKIFPVLVVSESMFSQPAVESYLTKEFVKIKPLDTDFRKINDLIVINLSYLINYFLNAEKRDFIKIIKLYIEKKKRYIEKGFIPDFPSIENIIYKEISKATQLIEIANELPISDFDLNEQLRRVRERNHNKS